MTKTKICFLFASIIFIFSVNAVPDSDFDGVPDADDRCPNSETTIADQFGCTCSQKNCASDNNPCTDDCAVVEGLASCNVIDDSNSCSGGYCKSGKCIENLPTLSNQPLSLGFRFEPNGGIIIANMDLWRFELFNANQGDVLSVKAYRNGIFQGDFSICTVPGGSTGCGASGTLDESNLGSWTGMVFLNGNNNIGTINFAVEALAIPTNRCANMLSSGNPQEKLDIEFIGDSYSRINEFIRDSNNFMDGLLSYEPFNSQRHKINVYRAETLQSLGCYYNCSGTRHLICCDSSRIEQAASACPHDQVIVIVNNNNYGGSGGVYSISYRGDYRVAVHEFGHSFGRLKDEYSYGPYPGHDLYYYYDGGNCDSSSNCPSWSGIPGTICVRGCQHDEWYRPKQSNSIMYDELGDFNPVGIRKLSNLMGAYS